MKYAVEIFNLTRSFEMVGGYNIFFMRENSPSFFFQLLYNKFMERRRVRKVIAVDHVNLNVSKGEILGLLGPNGSGKTTLLRLLACLIAPSEGTATVMGYDVVRERERAIRNVNYVPGILTGGAWVDYNLSARRNLEFFAEIFRLPKSRVDEALELAGLKRWAESKVASFSSGMAARLVLAIGLLREGAVYLLDEPTAGISPEGVKDFHDFIKDRLNKELGATVIYASHYVELVQELCSKVAIMDQGRIVVVDNPDRLIKSLGKMEVISIEAVKLGRWVLDVLREAPAVTSSSLNVNDGVLGEGEIKVQSLNSRESLPYIIDVLLANGVKIKFVKVSEPTLRDVFIKLTGRDMT